MRTHFSARVFLFAFVLLVMSSASFAQIRISVAFGPPALPVYEQPYCPGEGYIWTPGYWAWDNDGEDYYWVPGTWVMAPQVGYLWTPPYWAWDGGRYVFYEGYWGPHVGYYGGISYGFGYFGHGYDGGRWDHDRFYYNRSVTRINVVNIRNVYNERVVERRVNHISYNGGPGGISDRPRHDEELAARDHHIRPVDVQTRHFDAARGNREFRASANHGRPPVAATPRPAEFRDRDARPARKAGAPYTPPAMRNANRPGGENGRSRPVHARDLPPADRRAPPSTGNPNRDRSFQQQQDRMYAKQDRDRQKLQQRQERDDQRLTRQNAPDPSRQQVEQRHQQQTEQLQQKHVQQQQHFEQKAERPKHK
jgi:hypothetical protein